VGLFRYGCKNFDGTEPAAEYAGILLVDGLSYTITVRLEGKRVEKMKTLPLLLSVAVDEVE
jgi:hypothetical protein